MAASFCTTALLIIFLSHCFFVRQSSSVVYDPNVNSPLSRLLWGIPHYPRVLLPSWPWNPLKSQSTYGQSINSPEELPVPTKMSESLGKSWSQSGGASRLGHPERPEESGYYGNRYQREFSKRPLDTVGSGFMKKKAAVKRQLNQVGIGLMKRPLDHLGHGLFKKDLHQPGDETKAYNPEAKHFVEDRVRPMPTEQSEDKQSAVELIKKGLDVVGTGLFKRGGQHSPGLPELRTGLDQLYRGLGGGDPGKGVDVDMVRRGLDHLGGGLLKRGLDTVGIGLIKRGVDELDIGLSRTTSSKTLDTEGLGFLRKGLDHLAMVLEKDGVDVDGINMITKGAESLASWLIQQRLNGEHHQAAENWEDKKPEPTEKTYDDFPSGLSKKSFDELGTGLMKKGLHKAGSHPNDKFDRDFDVFASEPLTKHSEDTGDKPFLMETLDNLNYKYKKGFINKKEYAELRAAFEKEEQDKRMSKAFPKDIKLEAGGRRYDAYVPMRKKGLDEIGTGLMKKDLDYVGSGLIKKDLDEPEWREFDDPEMTLKEKLDWLKSDDRSPVGAPKHSSRTNDKSPRIPLKEDKSPRIPLKEDKSPRIPLRKYKEKGQFP